VLVAGLISATGAPRMLMQNWILGDFELVASPALLHELENVLLRPKFRRYVTEPEVRAYVDLVRQLATIVPDPPPIAGLTPDPGDDYLVALARAGVVQTLVSGNQHLCDLVNPVPPVFTPRQYLDRLGPE